MIMPENFLPTYSHVGLSENILSKNEDILQTYANVLVDPGLEDGGEPNISMWTSPL